jgi:hypothetical protein
LTNLETKLWESKRKKKEEEEEGGEDEGEEEEEDDYDFDDDWLVNDDEEEELQPLVKKNEREINENHSKSGMFLKLFFIVF